MALTTDTTPPAPRDLRDPVDLVAFVEDFNAVLSTARLVKHSPIDWLTLPAPHCFLLLDLADDPDDPAAPVVAGTNHFLLLQHIGPHKLAYALLHQSPDFAAQLLDYLQRGLVLLHADTIPRDVTND